MYLLDTNVLSEMRRGLRGNPGVNAWFAAVAVADVYISALVLGEISKGIARSRLRRDYTQAENLEAWLHRLPRVFGNRIIPVNADIAEIWGQMYAVRNVPVVDGLIAATAIAHDLTLVTRNIADVQGLGADLLNPFTG